MEDRPLDAGGPEIPQTITFDAIMPAAIAVRVEVSGVQRASLDPVTLFVLSILGGAFISFGGVFATTVSAGSVLAVGPDGAAIFSTGLPFGVIRLPTGLAFTLGVILIVVGGAELFTGSNLIVIAWASGKVRTRDVLLNWIIAFSGNFIGAFLTAVLMFQTTQYTFGAGAVGLTALTTANAKASLAFVPALALGVMCNALVCQAVWMCFAARTTVDSIFTIIPHHSLCCCRLRTLHRQRLFHSDGDVYQGGCSDVVLERDRQDCVRFPGFDMVKFLDWKFTSSHDRQSGRRHRHGRRGVLVRIFAKETTSMIHHVRPILSDNLI